VKTIKSSLRAGAVILILGNRAVHKAAIAIQPYFLFRTQGGQACGLWVAFKTGPGYADLDLLKIAKIPGKL
jgi:hypothetical protein